MSFRDHLWLRPLLDKKHGNVITALKDILQQGRSPQSVRSDKGSEFANRWVKNFMKEKDIYYYNTQNETKANYAERVIQTIKNMMYRYFTHNQTYRYIDVLIDLVFNYNNRSHKSLKNRTPASVGEKEAKLWKTMYVDIYKPKLLVKKEKEGPSKPSAYRFKLNDFVRVSHLKQPFDRSYQQKWSEEIFIIRNRFRKDGIPKYQLKDWLNEEIKGAWYTVELQKVNKSRDNLWKVDKVMKKRKKGGKKQVYISWMGWPKKFNQWIDEDRVEKI